MHRSIKAALTSKVYDVDDFTAAQELYHSNGWTDGLPVVPPTESTVEPAWNGQAMFSLAQPISSKKQHE